MQERVLRRALEKGGLTAGELDYVLAGDLLNQCIGTSFGLRSFHIPPSTGCTVPAPPWERACLWRQRSLTGLRPAGRRHDLLPLLHRRAPVPDAGPLRQPAHPPPPSGRPLPPAAVFQALRGRPLYHPRHLRPHQDWGITDANNIGAAMAPAAYDTPAGALLLPPPPRRTTTSSSPAIWGVGQQIVTDLFRQDGVDMTKTTPTAGCLLYHLEKQDMHAGGSGCGCPAAVFNGYLLQEAWGGPLEAPALRAPHRGVEPHLLLFRGVHPPASVMRWHFPPQRKECKP